MSTARLAKLTLQGADGMPLYVDIRSGARPGERRPAVVICHGFKGFKDWGFFPKVAERLSLAGWVTLSFNLSGSGVGDTGEFDELDRWARQKVTADLADLGTVVEYARQIGSGYIGLIGHSRGGGLAILAASEKGEGERGGIDALVTWNAIDNFLRFSPDDIARWRREGKLDVVNVRTGQVLTILRDALDDYDANAERLDLLKAAARVKCPWLIVQGAVDPVVTADVANRLENAASAGVAKLMMIDGGDHTFGIKHPWRGSTAEFDRVLDATVRHLGAELRP